MRPLAAVLLGIAALAGCVTVGMYATSSSGFDHAAHGKRDVSCLDCHAAAQKGAKADMPPLDMCTVCHDATKDPPAVWRGVELYKGSLEGATFPTPSVRGPSYADVRFDHGKHAAAKLECATCHEGATREAVANPLGPMTMKACIACHAERGASQDCKTCHEKTSKTEKPANHDSAWKLRHGFVSRAPDRATVLERCDVCHARADCDACHAQNQPRDHTNPFRVSTHGLSASMDRSRCLACHQTDSCERCHQTEPPRSHRTGFGAPRDTHCLTCHEPVGTGSCAVCHKGTPSHSLAAPKPAVPQHTPAMNCRQCHGSGAALPHVDNGTSCNACHH